MLTCVIDQARFAILRVLMRASENEPRQSEPTDGESKVPFLQLVSQETDVLISLNRSKIEALGMPALGRFLSQLQVYKSTADVDSARALFAEVPATISSFCFCERNNI